MDYLFHSTLKDTKLSSFVVSYDIACQWSINLQDRMAKYDPAFFVHDSKTFVRYLVPKFHLPAHIAKCRTSFSFNFAKETGRTDGEAPERGWVYINGLATSTREMGPGSRLDTLNYHMGDENWKKVNTMGQSTAISWILFSAYWYTKPLIGASLHRKMRAAAKDMAEQVIAHHELTSTIPEEAIERWTREVEAWEINNTLPNPYEVTIAGMMHYFCESLSLWYQSLIIHCTITNRTNSSSGDEATGWRRSTRYRKRQGHDIGRQSHAYCPDLGWFRSRRRTVNISFSKAVYF